MRQRDPEMRTFWRADASAMDRRRRRISGSSEALLEQADEKPLVYDWIAAEPLYLQADLDSFWIMS
jgi:hypothetical protein